MVVEFKEITFENVLSFGANPTTFEFNKGLNLITGTNGSGKSALLDAISFCLFGRPYRKIRIEELINRKNKKNLKITCRFVIDKRDEYIITRCLNKDRIEISKNGEELDLLSSKKLNQEEIDKIIGINYEMFKQIISLAVNYNRPFLSLPAKDKRDIIENIFNIKVFGQMLKSIKDKTKDLKIQSDMNRNTVSILEANLKTLRKHVTEMTDAAKNFDKNKQNELNASEKRHKTFQSEKDKLSKKLDTYNARVSKIEQYDDIDELRKLKDELVSIINKSEYRVKESTKSLGLLDENDVCPFCQSKITEKHKQEEVTRLNKIVVKETKIIESSKKKRGRLEKKIEKKREAKSKQAELTAEIARIEDRLQMVESELTHIGDRIESITNREMNFNLESLTNEFDEKKEEYKTVFQHGQSMTATAKNNDIVINILSESGIKAYFFKKMIPILNAKINEYLKVFDMPVMIEFDEFMNEKITNLENLRTNISYYSYSEGEKKRIDMSILLSFISITKVICNWNCNLLVIDELLDGAMDEKGLDKLVSSLKAMTADVDSLCVYIISHRLQQDYYEMFNSCIQVSKNSNNFSVITYE